MTDIRISTITKIGKLSEKIIELENLYNDLPIDSEIIYIEHGKNHKDKHPKPKKVNKDKPAKYFYNQITMYIYLKKLVNVKVFNNGSIQMTGIKNDQMGIDVNNIITKKLSVIYSKNVNVSNYKTVMVNSDFDYGYSIDPVALHRLIEENNYYSSYEPCNYPGVNIKYYYNSHCDKNNDGICRCTEICRGKGVNMECKRITVAVFTSGKTIITGGNSIEQIYIARDFIRDFIFKYKDKILINYINYVITIQRYYRNYRINKIK